MSISRPEECVPASNKKIQGSAVTLIWDLANLIFNLSKCQKRLEERNLLMKIPQSLRTLFIFWKEQPHHKTVQISQTRLEALEKSVQEITSKTAMASGGILSELRAALLQCLPVVELYREYLKSKTEKKSEAANAVECVIANIGEREKINIIDIGEKEMTCKEVKTIMDSLHDFYEPTNISLLLPENRFRRFKVLNQFLVQQSQEKICIWTFDNFGTAPQSVFAFLVKLEDDHNTIMKHIMRLRPQMLAQQKIFFPREFRQQFNYFSSSIVDMSSASMRMLMSMVLGDSRATRHAASKIVEERALGK